MLEKVVAVKSLKVETEMDWNNILHVAVNICSLIMTVLKKGTKMNDAKFHQLTRRSMAKPLYYIPLNESAVSNAKLT